MKIFDQTPFRTASGEIDIIGRVRGTLSHGMSWYPRIQVQDAVISIMEKALNEKYALLRNATLAETDIELPLVLIGPQGVFLINVVHERGVYRAKDDEWGTVSGEKFAPAAVNQVQRSMKLGRVLQVYLERAGFKDLLVEPILMAGDPGTHIESTRPAVRVIMSDALERFAISLSQGRPVLSNDAVSGIARTILNGPRKKSEPLPAPAAPAQPAESIPQDAFSLAPDSSRNEAFGFSFDDQLSAYQAGPPQDQGLQQGGYQGFESQDEALQGEKTPPFDTSLPPAASETEESESQPKRKSRDKAPASKKKGPFGMTTGQVGILVGLLLIWLCSMVAFAIYLYFNL